MLGNFNLPSVDHLREGVDYVVVHWNFADQSPAPAQSHTPGEPCGPGEKMVFGSCRKLREGAQRDEKDFDSSKKTKQEEELEKAAAATGKVPTTKEEAVAANAKGFMSGGKKYGWAMKDGKPVMVSWGSVAGEKKVGPAKPKQAPSSTPPATSGGSSSASSGPLRSQAAAVKAGKPLSADEMRLYKAGGGDAAASRNKGGIDEVIDQGTRNLSRRSNSQGNPTSYI